MMGVAKLRLYNAVNILEGGRGGGPSQEELGGLERGEDKFNEVTNTLSDTSKEEDPE